MGTATVIVVLHDVSSAQRLIDMARLVYGLGFSDFIVSKAYGAAASSGVPEASRLALRTGKRFAVLPSARDAVTLTGASSVFIVSSEYGEPMGLDELATLILAEEKPLILFGGIDPAPGKDVAGLGRPVYIRGAGTRLGPVAEAALILYTLRERLQEA